MTDETMLDGPKRLDPAAAIAAGAVGLAAAARTARGQERALPGAVVDVLNFALVLEEMETEFYTIALSTAGLVPADVRDVLDQIRQNEAAHVAFLRRTLGGLAIPKPQFDFTGGGRQPDVFSSFERTAATAQRFEETGTRAYKGQAATLMIRPAVLQAALQIHSCEARHVAELRRIRRQKGWITGDSRGSLPPDAQPTYDGEDNTFHFILAQPSSMGISMTEAFDEPLTKGQALDIVDPFIVGRQG